MTEKTPAQKSTKAYDQINDRGGLLDGWDNHELRIKSLERFMALCVGGSIVGGAVVAFGLDILKKLILHP